MKKLLLTGAMLVAFSFGAIAQSVILTEQFENSEAAYEAGWGNLDLDGNQSSFGIYQSNATLTAAGLSGQAAGSGNFTVSGSTATPAPDTDNVWWSPDFDVPADGAYLSFKAVAIPLTAGATADYQVYVIPAADLEEVETLEDFIVYLNGLTPAFSSSAPAAAQNYNVDLADYASETVSIIWRHRDNELPAYLFLDDVTVTSGVMSTDKVTVSKFSVSPNPANSIVTVANADNALVNAVSLTDMNGRVVKNMSFDAVSEAQVNVSDLANGVYLMTISSDKGSVTKKIVKN